MSDETEGHHPQPRRDTSALWERVEGHGSMIRALAEETSSQFRDFRGEVSAQIAGVSANVEKLANKFDASSARMAEASKPQYLGLFCAMVAAVGLSITIMQTLSGLHDKPVDDKLTSLSTAIGDLNRNTAQSISDLTKNTAASFGEAARQTVSQREFQQTLEFRQQLQSITTNFRDAQWKAMGDRIDKLEAEVVPRSEFTVRWAAEEKRDAQIEAEDENLTRRIDSLAPAGDLLRSMSDRQHELELRVYGEHH